MNRLRFTKMQGLGNDFVVLDAVRQRFTLGPQQARQLADRRFGIGCDQILLVAPPADPRNDFSYRIINADGSEVEQCGNGARCFARFVQEQGLSHKRALQVETAAGVIVPRLEENGQVTVDMGAPRFQPAEIPFVADHMALTYALELPTGTISISVVSMGNPHAVQVVEAVDLAPVAEQGPLIERHARFPQRVNAGFMQILSRHAIQLRVFERGSGETLACGTGACAAVVSGIRLGLLEPRVTVHTRGGQMLIEWSNDAAPVLMTGPAVTVFSGEIAWDGNIS